MSQSAGQIELPNPGPINVRIYNASLALAFLANFFEMVGISLLFRYSDFIESLGGTELHLGWIVGVGAVGAIVFRVVQGKAVDRLGPELIWIVSLIGQIVALVWHLNIENVNGVSIYLARILFVTSVAGNFGAWLSFTSLQAPSDRIAEVIGVIGSSGFLGMAVGPYIGDWIFAQGESENAAVKALFIASIVAISVGMGVAIFACLVGKRTNGTPGNSQPAQSGDPPEKSNGALRTLWRYQPGMVLVVGVMMGVTIGFAPNFLRPWAKSMSIDQIKVFFLTYNIVAFSSRVAFRRAPQVLGLKKTISVAWFFMACSMLLYLVVRNGSQLWLPAIAAGLAHSFLFPSVVAACSLSYPQQHRGLATNLILAMYDLGLLIGMPAIGLIVTYSHLIGLAAYPTTFGVIFVMILGTAIGYWMSRDREASLKPPYDVQ